MLKFEPQNEIYFISSHDSRILKPSSIAISNVGGKAFGLSCLPSSWTLPFLVISSELAESFFDARKPHRISIIEKWTQKVFEGLQVFKLDFCDIIIRSSGTKEGLAERGEYYSAPGTIQMLKETMLQCLEAIENDHNISEKKIPLIIQSYCKIWCVKGHISNELRFYKDKRDWVVEYITPNENITNDSINIRPWRKDLSIIPYTKHSLFAKTELGLSEALDLVARWALKLKVRLHFEWVWDGSTVYIVQADEEILTEGIVPKKNKPEQLNIISTDALQCLKKYPYVNSDRYPKLKNVGIYHKIGCSVAPIYVLDDDSIIQKLKEGIICEKLKSDLLLLTKTSLVIRMDIESEKLEERQFLPRTDGIRDINKAISWLIKTVKRTTHQNFVFILHNFIPSQIAAFAYAAPNLSTVYIEALWGLPEGLYHFSHDKYQVDTRIRNANSLLEENMQGWSINTKENYKQYIVEPDSEDNWEIQTIDATYGWKTVLEDEEILKKIALKSRRIAEEVQEGISIMWFVEVDPQYSFDRIIPWHHEYFEFEQNNKKNKRKTVFDKSYLIQSIDDVEKLATISQTDNHFIRWFKIQPKDSAILRDKNILKDIGKYAQACNATIYLEGGQLSHAYYQLKKTGASIELAQNFKEEKSTFNKLVRDKIPSKIVSKGENVYRAIFEDEEVLYLLKEKLIEESFEVFDAKNNEEITEEIADVLEVINAICDRLNINFDDVIEEKKNKYEKSGGFKDGSVLIQTDTAPPTTKNSYSLVDIPQKNSNRVVQKSLANVQDKSHRIKIHNDTTKQRDISTSFFTLDIPVLKNDWIMTPPSAFVQFIKRNPNIAIKIIGKRDGTFINIKFQAQAIATQLSLLDLLSE